MTDIAKRLRSKNCCDSGCRRGEAAEEIKRLQELVETLSWTHKQIKRLSLQEIEKLQGALELGRKMRLTQVAYFKDRSRDMLIASKMAEAEFDKACAALGGDR